MNEIMQHNIALKIAKNNLRLHNVTFQGLHVCTEAATNNYAYTACIAALAGAKVSAIVQDTAYGNIDDIIQSTTKIAKLWGVQQNLTFVQKPCYDVFADADIITNNGNVRPITNDIIKCLKKTAVIPLMWESFEWRPEELDLQSCHENEILVMGTDEIRINFLVFAAEAVIKILLQHGYAVHNTKILCLGSGIIMQETAKGLSHMGADVKFCAWNIEKGENTLQPNSQKLDDFLKICDYIICDERSSKKVLIGENGLIEASQLAVLNPSVVIVNRHGIMDSCALEQSNLFCIPTNKTSGWFFPHFTTDIIGVRPILELMCAGLKVGESMAKARQSGLSLEDAAKYAITHAPAQDMLPPFNWIKDNGKP